MKKVILQISNVDVIVDSKLVCSDINLTIYEGELHVLLGPNGSGKSSLLNAIMGVSGYNISKGEIIYKGQSINKLSIAERARLGIGMSFQHPPKIKGVTVGMFAKAINQYENLKVCAKEVNWSEIEDRNLNEGFSGGEMKRWEVMRLFLQKPQLCLFDEPESGVDFSHIAALGSLISKLMKEPTINEQEKRSGLLITHAGFILNYVPAYKAHMLVEGKLICNSEPNHMLQHIKDNGYIPLA